MTHCDRKGRGKSCEDLEVNLTVMWKSDYSLLLQGRMDMCMFVSLQIWFCLFSAGFLLVLCTCFQIDCEVIFLANLPTEILWGLVLNLCSSRGDMLFQYAFSYWQAPRDTPGQVHCIHGPDLWVFWAIQVVCEFRHTSHKDQCITQISLQTFLSSFTNIKVYAKQLLKYKNQSLSSPGVDKYFQEKKSNCSGYTYLPRVPLSLTL